MATHVPQTGDVLSTASTRSTGSSEPPASPDTLTSIAGDNGRVGRECRTAPTTGGSAATFKLWFTLAEALTSGALAAAGAALECCVDEIIILPPTGAATMASCIADP